MQGFRGVPPPAHLGDAVVYVNFEYLRRVLHYN